MQVSTIRLPLAGRVAARVQLGRAIDVTESVRVTVRKQPSSAALFTLLSSNPGEVIVTNNDGEIFITLTGPQAAMLNDSQIFHCMVELIGDGTLVGFVKTFFLIASYAYLNEELNMVVLLSLIYLNTLDLLGEAGGEGYLDGIETEDQAVGCHIQFKPADTQPEQWQLVAGNFATEPGQYRRPLDYSITNQKVWHRIS